MRDWRLPENRREAFQRFYSLHLRYRTHPGCVYFWLPAIADAYGLDEDQRAWLVWLNGNTENPVTSLLLLEVAPTSRDWEKAVAFWNENFTRLEWDTDRRHQKSKFGEATARWVTEFPHPAQAWERAGLLGWEDSWAYAFAQPYMGRLSAWSMLEYARILFGTAVPDADTLLLGDKDGSRSHRNSLGLIAGYADAVYWPAAAATPDMVGELSVLGESLLGEARLRNPTFVQQDGTRLTLESALCTWKSWHKLNRRYPNVYADMAYNRLLKAEARWGRRFGVLWDSRTQTLPDYLRLEMVLNDPGLVPLKQNWYLNTGEVPMMSREYPDMANGFDAAVAAGVFGEREDRKWS